MGGEMDLQVMLRTLQPVLDPETYVFCTVPGAAYGDLAQTEPLASFAEGEGLTLVMTQARADGAGLAYEGTFRRVTLSVHSSLQAVGLTAALATALAAHGVSANVIAAYHHDHVFVPAHQADLAMARLQAPAVPPTE